MERTGGEVRIPGMCLVCKFGFEFIEFWTSLEFLLHFCKALSVRTAFFTN